MTIASVVLLTDDRLINGPMVIDQVPFRTSSSIGKVRITLTKTQDKEILKFTLISLFSDEVHPFGVIGSL